MLTEGRSLDRVEVDVSAKVPREITEMGSLLDDGPVVDAQLPPRRLRDLCVRRDVARDRRHDLEIVVFDDRAHLLHDW